MTELGKLLQQTRKKKKYSLEQVNKLTRISQKYIKALEESDSSIFPAELYHKSFLKNYAKFLGLDLDEVLKMYEQEKSMIQYELFSNEEILRQTAENKYKKHENVNIEIKEKSNNTVKHKDDVVKNANKENDVTAKTNISHEKSDEKKFEFKKKKSKGKKLFLIKLILIIIFCTLFVSLLIIINVIFTQKKSNLAKEENIISVAVVDNNKEYVSEIKKEITKQVLEIEAIEDSWIRLFSDGNQIFEGILQSGQQQTCFADDNFMIRIGNIENLKLSFNGKPIDISVGAKNDKTNTLTFKKEI